MRFVSSLFVASALAVASLPAQNLIPNGEFEAGATGWTMTAFNDPLGTTGFAEARTTGNGPSNALYADFQTLTSVRSATWVSNPFTLPGVTLPIRFSAMWEKPSATPMPSPSVNRVELRIYDATNTRIFLGTLPAPAQASIFERASYSNTIVVPTTGPYTAELFLRHSNLAGIPFKCFVDDVAIGGLSMEVYGTGCAGAGSFVPVMSSVNLPAINTNNFAIRLHDAPAPTGGVLAFDVTNTSWGGVTLPFAFGGGCQLLAGLTLQFPTPILGSSGPGNGTASFTLPIPNDPTLIGPDFFTQWLVVDAQSGSPFGLTSSAGLRFRIQ